MDLKKVTKTTDPGYPSFEEHRVTRRSLLRTMMGGIGLFFTAGCKWPFGKDPEPQIMGEMVAPSPPVNQPVQLAGEPMPVNELSSKQPDQCAVPSVTQPVELEGSVVTPTPVQPVSLRGDVAMPEPVQEISPPGEMIAPEPPAKLGGKPIQPKPPLRKPGELPPVRRPIEERGDIVVAQPPSDPKAE